MLRLTIETLCALTLAGCCCKPPSSTGAGPGSKPSPASKSETPTQVQLSAMLSEYKANEVRADQSYKGKFIETSGTVDDVKKDILDSMYITLGTGKPFELPMVQCHLSSSQTSRAAALNKGNRATVRGRVDGLMFHVQLRDCELR